VIETRAKAPIGRIDELGQIDELARRAAAGRGSIVVIQGEPGIGKTSFVNEADVVARGYGLDVRFQSMRNTDRCPHVGHVSSRAMRDLRTNGSTPRDWAVC
jgi:hypothetical protein